MSYEGKVLKELLPMLENNIKFDLNKDLEMVRNLKAPSIEKSDKVLTTTCTIKGPGSELLLKVYEPKIRQNEKLPAVFWIHGGGYVMGHPDGDDALCECFTEKIKCIVVSIDYRLAPEHKYPAAIEDCYAGLKWTVSKAEELKIDTSRIAIAGASAGGGLTAALALMVRDRGEIKVAFQAPLYPMLDDRNVTPSSHEINEKNLPKAWNREANEIAWKMYLGSNISGETSYYAAPARAKDLTGLPPAYIFIGQLDPFRDETLEYVTRLVQAGIPVEFHLYPGCFHGFDSIFNNTEISRQARSEYINAISKALNK
ncbi:Acetyl esterase/lipase [Clostridium acidisoli DSM 12555]|uniref:Acetyl esterase/lipase n=1 Tax=Clostridium acidisoli DSM 12555 TaxID=1121291 RepID=A0A1W1XJC3_9CLOT|nr:alpha/beta hydrolase [Clostridium acidisoli]SMC24069.1 Acetyl esterase/lipase [Clostridium acidisoli DSM 12555]